MADTAVNANIYGAVIPVMFGSARLVGKPVWAGPVTLNGDNSQDVTFAVMLGKRDPLSVSATLAKVWIDGVLVYTNDGTAVSGGAFNAVFYNGDEAQRQDPDIVAVEGATKTPAFRDRMYLVIKQWNVAAAQQFPVVECEVVQRVAVISKRYGTKYAATHFIDTQFGASATAIADYASNMFWTVNQASVFSYDIALKTELAMFAVPYPLVYVASGRYTPFIFFADRFARKLYAYDAYGNRYEASFALADFTAFASAGPVMADGTQYVYIADMWGALTVAKFDAIAHTITKRREIVLTYTGRDPYSQMKFLPVAKMQPANNFTFGYFMKFNIVCLAVDGLDDSNVLIGRRIRYYTDADGIPGGANETDYMFSGTQAVECADLTAYLASIGRSGFVPRYVHCDPQEGKWISIIFISGTNAIWIRLETVFAKLGIQRPGHTVVGGVVTPNRPALPSITYLAVTDWKDLPGNYFPIESCVSCPEGENIVMGQHSGNNYFLDMQTGVANIIPIGTLIDDATGTVVPGNTSEQTNTIWNNKTQTVLVGGIVDYQKAAVEYRLYVTSNAGTTLKLSNFVKSLAMLADIPLADIVTENIEDEFTGGIISEETDLFALVTTLGETFRFDVADLGGVLRASRRVRDASFAVDATYYEDDLAYLSQGSTDDGAVLNKRRDNTDTLPAAFTLEYIASEDSYKAGAYTAKRTQFPVRTVTTKQTQQTKVPIAMTAAVAARWAEAALFDAWSQAITVGFALPARGLALTAGDYVSVVTATKGVYVLRMTSVYTNVDYSLLAEGRSITAIAPDDTSLRDFAIQPPVSPRVLSGNFACFVIDNIALQMGETAQRLYAFGSEPLVAYFYAADGTRTASVISAGVPVGKLLTALPAVALWAIDLPQRDLFVDVRLSFNAIGAETISDDDWFAGKRVAIIGAMGRWEAVYYKQLSINANGTVRLTGLMRGQFGSDTVDARIVGDNVVFMTQSPAPILYNEYGGRRAQITVTYPNTLPTSALAKQSAALLTGGSLKPFAPGNVVATNVSGDVVFTWNRRDRGAYVAAFDPPPLSDAPMLFDLEIMAADGTVKRTFAAIAVETVTYTAANIAADGFTASSEFSLRLYQLSPTVGRGHMRAVKCLAN